jgi:hypothetical protein
VIVVASVVVSVVVVGDNYFFVALKVKKQYQLVQKGLGATRKKFV